MLLHPIHTSTRTLLHRAKCALISSVETNLVCINANGLRTKRKKTCLSKLLKDLKAGICVVTETHLRKRDLKYLKIDHFVLVADYRRPTPIGGHIYGGSVILVHENFTAEELPEVAGLPPHLEHCSAKSYPTADPRSAMRISGLYVSPTNTKRLVLSDLERISTPLHDAYTQDAMPHIIAGDLNTTGWPDLYEEWLQTAALNE